MTIAPHCPASLSCVMSDGQVNTHDPVAVTLVLALAVLSDEFTSLVEEDIVAELPMTVPSCALALTL